MTTCTRLRKKKYHVKTTAQLLSAKNALLQNKSCRHLPKPAENQLRPSGSSKLHDCTAKRALLSRTTSHEPATPWRREHSPRSTDSQKITTTIVYAVQLWEAKRRARELKRKLTSDGATLVTAMIVPSPSGLLLLLPTSGHVAENMIT